MKFDTKETDIKMLIQFVRDQGFDLYELTQAANRLENMLNEELADYAYSEEK